MLHRSDRLTSDIVGVDERALFRFRSIPSGSHHHVQARRFCAPPCSRARRSRERTQLHDHRLRIPRLSNAHPEPIPVHRNDRDARPVRREGEVGPDQGRGKQTGHLSRHGVHPVGVSRVLPVHRDEALRHDEDEHVRRVGPSIVPHLGYTERIPLEHERRPRICAFRTNDALRLRIRSAIETKNTDEFDKRLIQQPLSVWTPLWMNHIRVCQRDDTRVLPARPVGVETER